MGRIHVGWEVKTCLFRASLVNKIHFPNTEKKKESRIRPCSLPFDSLACSKGKKVAML